VTLHPFDVAQQADALHTALTMDRELRRERHRHAAQVVRHNDVRRWLTVQLGRAGRAAAAPLSGSGARTRAVAGRHRG
jgi:trehalose-6-phosphate synthase